MEKKAKQILTCITVVENTQKSPLIQMQAKRVLFIYR